MKREEVKQKVFEIITDQIGIDREHITPEAKLAEDLSFDSLDVVTLLMASESEFDIVIADEKAEEWKTIDDAINLIVELMD